MKKIFLFLFVLLSLAVPSLYAGTCTVDATSTYQYIRGIGASSAWYGLAGASAASLFADDNINGHIGISSLRARIDPNGNHSGEVNNLVAAKAANPNLLCWATEWSPPAQYKANNNVNGPASNNTFLGASSGTPNSADTGYASYLVSYIQYAKSRGIDLYAVSVQNEPNWNPDYEACLWTAGQFEVFARAFHDALSAAGLSTKIMIPEPINPGGLNLASTSMNSATTAPYIGIIGTHLYGGMPNALSTYGFTHVTNQEFWETEISANTTDISGALQQAGWMQTCLVTASMNAFHYWWIQDLATNGSLNIKAFALGNYSKFIRPGYYRMGATAAPTSGVQVSAFKNTNNSSPSKIVFVAINNNTSSTSQTFALNGLNVTSVTPWLTNSGTGLVAQSAVAVSGNSFTYTLPAQSIVSFVASNNGGATPTNTPVVPTATSTPCAPTAIVAYVQVNGGAWTQANSATVASLPATVNLGPQPVTGGSWSWTGPNGFTSTSRELLGIALSTGTNVYTATYTNDCGAKSTQAFTITVQGSATNTPTTVTTPVSTPITNLFGGNPLMYQKYTADPTAAWFNNRMYIYCSHDQTGATGYNITDVTLMSSDDLVNWTDEGEAVKASNTSWAGLTYAPDAVYRNGYYYVYFGNGGGSIGVVRSTSPTGPFTDPVGHAIVTGSTPGCSGMTYVFDPAVFVDDDGQAYMYFGGGGVGNARVIKLNSDMISVNGSAVTIDAPRYFEAPFINKRNGMYYFSYCTDFSASPAASIDYMTSSSPMSGFTYRGTILSNPSDNCGNNSHASIVNIGDNWYLAYHTRRLSNINLGSCNGIYQRSVALDRRYFNADGTIQKVIPTTSGVNALKTVNPYTTIKAVMMAKESGITTETCSEGGLDVANIENNDWIQVKNFDFGAAGASGFNARVASATSGGNIVIHLDSTTGPVIGTCAVAGTGGWQTWQTKTCSITGATGLHDVYLVFTGASGFLFNLESYSFTQGAATPTNTAVPPTATFTATKTNTPVPPTATFTPTNTKTNTPVPPTATPTTPVPTNTPTTPTATPTTPVPTDTPVTPAPTDTPIVPSPTSQVPTNTPVTPSPTPTTPVPTNTPITPSPTPTTPVPTSTPTVQVSNLMFMTRNSDTNNSTNSPHPQVRVVNTGNTAVSLTNIEVRYWINSDSAQSVQAYVDYAGKVPSGANITSNVTVSYTALAKGSQTGYIAIRFTGSLSLAAGETAEIQLRFNKSDWSNMTQSNDWSYTGSTAWQQWNKTTAYSQGSLIWGQEPPVNTATVQVSNVLTYPNPATSSSGATLSYSVNSASTGVTAADAGQVVYVPSPDAKVVIGIYTIAGRLVWQQTLQGVYYVSTGDHKISWDGRASGEKELSPGTYTLKVTLKDVNVATSGFSRIIMLK